MGCCWCCLDEGQKVGRVMKAFPAVSAVFAEQGAIQKLTGYVTIAGTTPFVTPADGKPCVYFHFTLQEEHIKSRRVRDSATGRDRVEKYHEWVTCQVVEKFCDFYLQDGSHKVFVNGANRGQCKVQASTDVAGQTFSVPSWGVAMLMNAFMPRHKWGRMDHRTGRFRYFQRSFDVNEKVTALGVVQDLGADPYTGQAVKRLLPITLELLHTQFPPNPQDKARTQLLKDMDRFIQTCPSVMLSDDPSESGGVNVQPPLGLPIWMTQPMVAPPSYNMYDAQPQYAPAPQHAQQPGYTPPPQQQPGYAPQLSQPPQYQQQSQYSDQGYVKF